MDEDQDFRDQQEVFALLGMTLYQISMPERLLRETLLFILPDERATDVQAFIKGEAELSKRTLGVLITRLRERVQVEASFNSELEGFLEDRNRLIHNLHTLPGNDLSTLQEREMMTAFLQRLQNRAQFISTVLFDLMFSWRRARGPLPQEMKEGVDLVSPDMRGISRYVFRPKPAK